MRSARPALEVDALGTLLVADVARVYRDQGDLAGIAQADGGGRPAISAGADVCCWSRCMRWVMVYAGKAGVGVLD